MGSVKDLTVVKPAGENSSGLGVFIFSDRYSVFDWGEMPDHIPDKGASLCILSSYFFELLESKNIKTHYICMEDEEGREVYIKDLEKPARKMRVRLYRVVEPFFDGKSYDYSHYRQISNNYLIPLEVIYRFSLPQGSSVFKRLEKGEISPEDLGLKEYPKPGTILKEPFIDFSTKLEHFDRYLSRKEAKEISGLSHEAFEKLISLAVDAALLIKKTYEKHGIYNEDGKFEFAVDENGEIVFVDALGTPDECRFTKDGFTLSKEFARIFYRGSDWHREVEKAKELYGKDWRDQVKTKPEKLPPDKLKLISDIYRSLANTILEKEIFADTLSLDELISYLKRNS